MHVAQPARHRLHCAVSTFAIQLSQASFIASVPIEYPEVSVAHAYNGLSRPTYPIWFTLAVTCARLRYQILQEALVCLSLGKFPYKVQTEIVFQQLPLVDYAKGAAYGSSSVIFRLLHQFYGARSKASVVRCEQSGSFRDKTARLSTLQLEGLICNCTACDSTALLWTSTACY